MIRVQHSRGKKLPAGVRYVGRPSRWGNPFKVEYDADADCWLVTGQPTYHQYRSPEDATYTAVVLFCEYATERLAREPGWLDPLRHAKGLACYCPPESDCAGSVCHADVLISLIRETAPA